MKEKKIGICGGVCKECRMKVVNLIMPHVKSVHYNIARSMPSFSRSTGMPDDTNVVWVYNVKTKNSTSFKEVVGEISKAVKKAEGDNRGTWYTTVGGAPEVSDYFVGVPYKNFAAMDVERDGVWKIYEKANGKSKTNEFLSKIEEQTQSRKTKKVGFLIESESGEEIKIPKRGSSRGSSGKED